MKNFAGIKNIRRFVSTNKTTSGIGTRNILTGIFYALSIILITVSTPAWSVNAPTARRVLVSGKGKPFLFFPNQRTTIMSLTNSRQECSNGITTPHKTRTPTKRVSDYHPFNSAQEFRSFYRAVAEQESDLKNETWAFLVHKKLYQEYMVWRKANRTKLILAGIIKGIKVG